MPIVKTKKSVYVFRGRPDIVSPQAFTWQSMIGMWMLRRVA
ncbi:MAG: hypothetical protein WBD34_22185 [Burkholderiaceae bacterium]